MIVLVLLAAWVLVATLVVLLIAWMARERRARGRGPERADDPAREATPATLVAPPEPDAPSPRVDRPTAPPTRPS